MPNHFHLVVETPQANLVAGMKWLLGTYTSRFNRRHKVFGHLFSGRYKALIVDGSGNGCLRTVCDYVHLNPSRARLLKPEELKRRKWNETALAQWRKGDKGKVAIALRLRAESTVTLAWIAERLRMGTATHLAHLLYWHRREKKMA